jgi:hypothetical protein
MKFILLLCNLCARHIWSWCSQPSLLYCIKQLTSSCPVFSNTP